MIKNYTPHKTPDNPNFSNWCNIYSQQLSDMYTILINNIPNHESSYLDFQKFIYKNSSKYLSPF